MEYLKYIRQCSAHFTLHSVLHLISSLLFVSFREMWYISLLYLSLHLGKYDTTESAILILLISTTGSAIFIKHPTNVTTCQGLSAMFTCGVNETTTIIWFINGIDSRSLIYSQPKSETLPHGSQSTLTCPATSQLQGASVQCHYVLGVQVITSYFAYLIVQGMYKECFTLDL